MKTHTKSENSSTGKFENKLVRYALAGTAILGLPTGAQANIAGITQTGTITANSANTPQYLPIYFDNPLLPDFLIVAEANANAGQSYAAAFVYDPQGAATFSGPIFDGVTFAGLFPTAFSAASLVTSSPSTGLHVGKLAKSAHSGLNQNTLYGNFPVNGSAFLGVVFQTTGGDLALGTVDLSIHENTGDSASSTVSVLGTSYGPVTGSETPEPSYLPLYALGAAGLALARKRRSAR